MMESIVNNILNMFKNFWCITLLTIYAITYLLLRKNWLSYKKFQLETYFKYHSIDKVHWLIKPIYALYKASENLFKGISGRLEIEISNEIRLDFELRSKIIISEIILILLLITSLLLYGIILALFILFTSLVWELIFRVISFIYIRKK